MTGEDEVTKPALRLLLLLSLAYFCACWKAREKSREDPCLTLLLPQHVNASRVSIIHVLAYCSKLENRREVISKRENGRKGQSE